MQAAKDTFLKTLATRLAAVNPARTVVIDGAARAAALTVENENVMTPGSRTECFLLNWESSGTVSASLQYLDCKVSYSTRGTAGLVGTDRGRTLTAMDTELRQICSPRWAAKCDSTQTPPAALGTDVFWSRPVMAEMKDEGSLMTREATIRLYFFPEVS